MSQDFWADMTQQRAAKPHRCVWCGQRIDAGHIYNRQIGVFGGEFQANRWHPESWDAADFSVHDEFMPHENDRPPTAAGLEFRSWDFAALAQRGLLCAAAPASARQRAPDHLIDMARDQAHQEAPERCRSEVSAEVVVAG